MIFWIWKLFHRHKVKKLRLNKNEILVLRTCDASMISYGGFEWPKSGRVFASDWEQTYKCGNGLHGLPWGCGSIGYLNMDKSSVWLVVRVSTEKENYMHGEGEMTDKCKFCTGEVVYCGDRDAAVKLITRYAPSDVLINFATQTAGDEAKQTAGDEAKQTAGNGATQTAGDCATQTAGDCATQTAGNKATQTAGDEATQTAGYGATQTAGDEAKQTAGYGATQTAGYGATQTAGDEAKQTAGNGATQTAGYWATQTAGDEAKQTAGNGATQTAGNKATQTAGNGTIQTAGLNTVQICTWWENGKRKVASRVITKAEAGKPYKFERGTWTEDKKL